MKVILYIFRIHLISVYFFVKIIFKQKRQVFFLSRQFSELSLNYKAIIERLEKEKIGYTYICEKVESGINDSIRTQGNYSNGANFAKKILKNINKVFKYYFSLYKQMRLIAQSKVIIIDGYNLPVSLLKHKKGTKVIQMWHALGAIKKFGYQSIGTKDGISKDVATILKMHANYDYVLSGSKGMNKYFAEAFNVDINKVLEIGTPIVDYMRLVDEEKNGKIYEKYPNVKGKINVLYSPTFRNDKRDNTQELINNFDFNKCNLIITKHPKVETTINDDRVIQIDCSEFSTFDIVKICDYVITDYSALMIDAAIANKKILMYVYDYDKYKSENGINIEMLEEFPNISKVEAKDINSIIIEDKYDQDEFKKFREKYVTNPDICSTDEIVNLIKRCLDA